MKIFTAQSLKTNPKEAVLELKEKLNYSNIKAITFFASSIYDPENLITAMNENFPNIYVWGCTTMGEMITGSIISNSIVAMAFTDEIIEDIKIEVLENTKQNIDIKTTIRSFEDYYSTKLSKLDKTKYFGLTYFDGISKKEEIIISELGEYTNMFFVGGSAGDDLKFDKTYTFANGRCYLDAAIIVLIKSKVKFGFEKTQSVSYTGHTVVATKVDEENRLIYELDGRPTGEVYSELLNVPIEEIPSTFTDVSFALMIDGQPYLRALQHMGDKLEFRLACAVKERQELAIVKTGDIIKETQKTINEMKKKHNSISGILLFDCGYRYFELVKKEILQEYINLFSDFPTVGFCTYGETYFGHLNQTLIMLVLE